MWDAVVVGAGPAGCGTAAELAKTHDVLVLEEHAVSGKPVQCTGLISTEVVRLSGVKPDILNSLYGAHVHFPGGQVISVSSKEPKAVLVMRDQLDSLMADKAVSNGADIRYKEKYLGHSVSEGSVKVVSSNGEFQSKAIIGADGHNSAVSKNMGNPPFGYFVRGMQADLRHEMEDQGVMVMRLGSDFAPGFFTWQIPFGEYTRVGLCVGSEYGPPADYFRRLLKVSGLEDCEVVAKHSGRIPLEFVRRSYGDRSMLIGDSAGQVKPVSGGGLHPAFNSIPALCDTFRRADAMDDFSAKSLSKYEKGWKKAVESELNKGRRMRRFYDSATDRDLEKASSVSIENGLDRILDNIDLDRPSKMVSAVMRKPKAVAGLLPIAVKCAWRSLF